MARDKLVSERPSSRWSSGKEAECSKSAGDPDTPGTPDFDPDSDPATRGGQSTTRLNLNRPLGASGGAEQEVALGQATKIIGRATYQGHSVRPISGQGQLPRPKSVWPNRSPTTAGEQYSSRLQEAAKEEDLVQ